MDGEYPPDSNLAPPGFELTAIVVPTRIWRRKDSNVRSLFFVPIRTCLSQDSNVRQVMSLDTRRLKAELHSTRCKAGYFRLHFRCVIVLKQEIRLLGYTENEQRRSFGTTNYCGAGCVGFGGGRAHHRVMGPAARVDRARYWRSNLDH